MTIQRCHRFLSSSLGQRNVYRSISSFMLLCLTIMGLPALSAAQQACPPDGDVDRTGSVTAADALLAFQQALGLAQLDVCQQSIADVSSDGRVTASDALCIFQKALSLPSCLDSVSPPNQPPVADAGPDQLVNENDVVTLPGSGSDSDGSIAAYRWVQTSGAFVAVSGANTQNASFTAPEIAPEDAFAEELEFQLRVTDDDGASATDTVVISVFDSYFIVDNDPPIANAGPDQTVDENTLVTLSGSGTDPDGTIEFYEWLQIDGTTVHLSDPYALNPSFTAPDVAFAEQLVFALTVVDDAFDLATDTVTITVVESEREPQPPVEQYALDVSVFGEGDIQVQGTGAQLDCTEIAMCHGKFNQGDEVVLIAEPDSGWTHENWIGCDRQDLLGRCTVFMDGDRLVSVTFLSADPLEFHDNVLVLRDDQLQGLIHYDLAAGLFVFDAGTSDIGQWVVGTIVLAAEDPNEGLTIARRITGIERTGNQIAFTTEQASLEEIFRSGSFSYHGDTDAGESDAGTLQYPGPIVTQAEDGGRRIPINIDLGGGVRAGGWITFPVEPHFTVNFSPLEFRVLAIAMPTASIGLEISGSVMISEDYELWSQGLRTIWIPNPVVPILPIPVFPTLEIIIEGDAEASAELRVGAEIYVTATAGVHYKDGKLNRIFEFDVDPLYRVNGGLDFDLNWNVEVRARGELNFRLLGVVGAYAGVVPYYGISSGCGDSFAETYKGWRLELGGDFTVIGGPRLALPVHDSLMPHKRISLSRTPSGDSRCEEGPEEEELTFEWIRAQNVDCHIHQSTWGNINLILNTREIYYSGGCKERKAHGRGTLTASEFLGVDNNPATLRVTVTYEGDWSNGWATGQGTWSIEGGTLRDRFYEGGFLNGQPHGRGTLTRYGAVYEGERHSTVYEGEFRNGFRHGQGTHTWADGSRYEGGWHVGSPHGQGTHTFINGAVYEGEWRNGSLWNGTRTYLDGVVLTCRDGTCTRE